MKKIVIYIVSVIFMFSGLAIAGQKQKGNHDNNRRGYEQEQRDVHQYRKKQGYKKNRGNHYGHGYRDRYYGHRPQPPKHYHGHWRSWDDWDRYYRSHRHEYRNQRYYRDSRGSLYFEFETDEGRFAFSIGR